MTREMDYAIRIVRALYRNGQLSAAQIAKKEQMQKAITYKVLKKLAKAKIVESRRGIDGGYRLCKPCNEFRFYDLFLAVKEDLLLTECLKTGYLCENNENGHCGAHREFCRIQQILETELKRTPLNKLL